MKPRRGQPKPPDIKRSPIVPPGDHASAAPAAGAPEGSEVEPPDASKVLVVDSDRQQRAQIAGMLDGAFGTAIRLSTAASFDAGLRAAISNRHDVCLFGSRVGKRSGIDLLRESVSRGCRTPIILVTSDVSRQADLDAMRAGAADCLVPGTFGVAGLERAIRYARERGRTISALRESEERFRALIDASFHGIVIHDGRTILEANQGFARMLGYQVEEVLGRELIEFVAPEDKLEVTTRIGERSEQIYRTAAIRKDGSRLSLEAVGRETLYHASAARVVALRDITDQGVAERERERLYREAEQARRQVRELVQDLGAVVWEADPVTLQLCYVSPDAEKRFGYPVSAWREDPDFWSKLIHPEDLPSVLETCRRYAAAGADHALEYRVVTADGRVFWVHDVTHVVKDTEGKAVLLRGVMVDVSVRKVAEQERHDTNADLQALLNAAPLAVIALDSDGAIRSWNPAAEKMFGWSAAEVVGSTEATIPPDQMAQVLQQYECAQAGETVVVECPRLTKDGRRIVVCVALAPVVHRGLVRGMIAIVDDMSQRKQLEEQLRQAQKMEAIGRLAGGIAHDFNNLLTAILGYAELLTDSLADQVYIDDVLEIKRAANRAAGLTRQLLAFSRRQVLLPTVLDLNAVVANMDSMLRRLIGEDVELNVVLAPSPHTIEADAGQIEQVILNLALNARDAMPSGGRLTIEATRVELDEAYALVHPAVTPGRYIMLAVSDTGCGMDEATRARIFEPFFTTKQDGRGTGLGLATVYGIVKQSGGWVWAYSEPGKGSSFKIYLPSVDTAVTAAAKVSPAAVSAGGQGEIVLLVEDEQGVRDLAASVLRRAGYGVMTAANGPDAISLVNTGGQAPSLVLTDVVMPQMSGPQLVGQLQARAPELKVIYMSGYTDHAIVHHGILAPGANFLQKPFTPAALTGKVRRVLDALEGSGLTPPETGVTYGP